jgi:Spy/CpxP family protein refolding chaperone
MGGLRLLRSERIQAELHLTEEQRAKIEELGNRIGREMRERAREIQGLSGDEYRRKSEELEEQFKKEAPDRALAIHREIEALLQPEQLKRYREIELRDEGPWTLLRPDVIQELELTDFQKDQLEEISRDTQEEMREVFRAVRENEASARPGSIRPSHIEQSRRLGAKVEQARKEGLKKAAGVLTREQGKKLLEMMGKPLQTPGFPDFAPHPGAEVKPRPENTPPKP